MTHAFAELREGTMARVRDNSLKTGRNLGHTRPFSVTPSFDFFK